MQLPYRIRKRRTHTHTHTHVCNRSEILAPSLLTGRQIIVERTPLCSCAAEIPVTCSLPFVHLIAMAKRSNQESGVANASDASTSSTVRLLRPLLHLLAALHFCYGIYYDCSYVFFADSPQSTHFGGKFKYLTFLDMVREWSQWNALASVIR